MRRPTHKNTCLSAIQAHARPPNARTSKKTLKYTDVVVNSMILTSQALGSKSIYAENKEVVTTVTTKGTVHSLARFTHVQEYSLQLFLMVCRKGGPTLSTMPEKMYWKQDTRKRVVFSEFSIFDFSVFSCGGMNLGAISQYAASKRLISVDLPRLSLYILESDELCNYAQQYLTQQWSEHLSRN